MPLERAGVLPLRLIPGRRGERNLDDLVGRALFGIAVFQRVVVQEVGVEPELGFARERRLQQVVAERNLLRNASHDVEHLVLRFERRPQAGRAVGCAELELVHARNVNILADAVRGGQPLINLRPLLCTEQ